MIWRRSAPAARVLAGLLRAALEHLDLHGGRTFEYSQMPDAVVTGIAHHFGLNLTAAQIEAMSAKIPFNAKTPQLFFEPDTESKQQEAGAEARALCAVHLDALYRQLQSRSA